MKDINPKSIDLIIDSYEKYYQRACLYIRCCIYRKEDAEDLAQDVFIRLMEYKQMLRKETVKSFIFIIARHIVVDYLRRYYKRQKMTSYYLYDCVETSVEDVESRVVANDLEQWEWKKVYLMPFQRRRIYCMSRFGGKSATDIATILNLSSRTVENHLFLGRKEVREYLRMCI